MAVSAPVARGVSLLYSTGRPDSGSNNPSPNLEIVNHGNAPVSLASLEARYYFTAEALNGQSQILDVDWASFGASNVQGTFVPLGGDAYYLRLTFARAAGLLAPGATAQIKLRIHKPDWSPYDQTDDYSFGPITAPTPWPRIPLFQDGRLIWGSAAPAPKLSVPAAPRLEVQYADGRPDAQSNNPSPNLRIVNGGSASVPLSQLEVRYYFTAEGLAGQPQILDVDWASFGAENVTGDFVHLGGDQFYLRLRFLAGAGELSPAGTAEIKFRIHKSDWSPYDQTAAFSFGPSLSYTPWPRIPLFRNGQPVWGTAPAPPQ